MMNWGDPKLIILVAEDDENDAFMLTRAFRKEGIGLAVHVSPDGEDAMNYLKGVGPYADRGKFPFPRLIVTDLKMPVRSGFDILAWLQKHPECNLIPKIVLSGSGLESDIIQAYQLGANAFFTKPTTVQELGRIVRAVEEFWNLAKLPPLPAKC
jgi:CheY-like chemotaxis protein